MWASIYILCMTVSIFGDITNKEKECVNNVYKNARYTFHGLEDYDGSVFLPERIGLFVCNNFF